MLAVTIVILVLLLALGLPVAVVMGSLALFLDLVYSPVPLHLMLGGLFWQHSVEFVLLTIPLFVLMGEIILHAGIAGRMYTALASWLGWLPGGLMHANIGTCALFAATSGSSIATAATIGSTAMPQLKLRGYNERLFLGSLAAGGTLGILIPPSMNMIVFGFLTNTSIPKLFLAGIIPGMVLTVFYMLIITLLCLLRPSWSGVTERVYWSERLRALLSVIPPLALFILVIGSIYEGFATPTEAAALGVVGALGLAAWNRTLSFSMLARVAEETVRTSMMLMLILVFAFFLNFVIAALGLVQKMDNAIVGLHWSPVATILLVIGMYIVMGMFMETLAMMVLTVPTLAPLVSTFGFDPVWFGIVIVLVCETAMLTPPVGMACYVIQGVRDGGQLNDVFFGIIPFLFGIVAMIALLLMFPEICLWLPNYAHR
jgi:tripartite ATP-independent transporter DctM subunit